MQTRVNSQTKMSDPNEWDYYICAYSNVQMIPIIFNLGILFTNCVRKRTAALMLVYQPKEVILCLFILSGVY